MNKQPGNCYAASEALWYILGAEWKPMVMRVRGGTHWFLKHKTGIILDPSVLQFSKTPDYSKARGCGFLTKRPSKRAWQIMKTLTFKRHLGETGTRPPAKRS